MGEKSICDTFSFTILTQYIFLAGKIIFCCLLLEVFSDNSACRICEFRVFGKDFVRDWIELLFFGA